MRASIYLVKRQPAAHPLHCASIASTQSAGRRGLDGLVYLEAPTLAGLWSCESTGWIPVPSIVLFR